MKNSSILPRLGILAIYLYFCFRSDFISALPSTLLFSIPLLINLCLSAAIDRPSTHHLNNLSAGFYILIWATTVLLTAVFFDYDFYFIMSVIVATPLGPILLILFPSLWITTWCKRDSETND